MSELNASAVKKMKVPELRSELTKRGLDSKGLKQVLVDRLLEALSSDQEPVESTATEGKEVEEEETAPATDQNEVVADNEKDLSDTSIAAVTAEPPPEIMVEDAEAGDVNEAERVSETVEDKEAGEEKPVEEEHDDAMENDTQDDEKTAEERTDEEQQESEEPMEYIIKDSIGENEDEQEANEEHDDLQSNVVVEDEKDETDDSSVVFSRYISDLYFKISPDGLTGKMIDAEGFSYIWGGAKMTWGVNKGKVCYECKVLKNVENELPDSEEPKNGLRVGWSVEEASLQLGEDSLSYGYDSSGKSCTASDFSDYGVTFTEGDVIGCYLDFESCEEERAISFTKNGEDLGVAFVLSKEELEGKVLFPHVVLKNTECQINTGGQEEPWFACKEDFTLVQVVGTEDLVEGKRGYKEKNECEVIMMVGLPASGKTTWVKKHVAGLQDKKYNIIGTNTIMDRMKINGEERKRKSDDFDKLMDKATKCLKTLFELAPTKKRNYILDQTNVHSNAQKRKMDPFKGFKRKAVIVVPKAAEQDKRAKEKKEQEGFEIPEYALLDMKANYSVPRVGWLFDEVTYVEEQQEDASKIISDYRRSARSSQSRGQSYRPRRDDHKGSGRYHPYKRDDHHNRSHYGGGRDFRHSGSGGRGGSSNYGRQHGGGGSYNRRGGGYNKGYQHNSRGGGGRGGFQKGYYQQQQQRYGGGYMSGQYGFNPQPYGVMQNPYQQTRTAYGGYQQQMQYYGQPQQNYYPQTYGQFGRRY